MKKRKPKTFNEAAAEAIPAGNMPTDDTPANDTTANDTPANDTTAEVTPKDAEPNIEVEADELTKVKQERDKHYEQLQRTLADLQNFRKRRGQEMADIRMLAVKGLIAELLPVLDNFHLATHAATDDNTSADGTNAVREGLVMVKAMLEGVLEHHGLKEIPAAQQTFDPTLHEAVGLSDTTDVEPGQVAKVIQTGYFLSDKVLRHAKVLVAGDVLTRPEDDIGEGGG
jgi:molecular chaperone GrpE